jgi:uncharacterized protein (UPF0303 family)
MGEYSIEQLLDQERELTFVGFDNSTAINLGCFVLQAATDRKLPVAIAISRNGQQLFYAALPGTSLDNEHWVARKSAVVHRFGHSSFYMGQSSAAADVSFNERYKLSPHEYSAYGGSFPIIVEGTGLVGSITVSGLPQKEDHEFIVEMLRTFNERQGH